MLGIAVMLPLAAGAFDLSVGATTNLTAVTVAVLQTNRDGMWTSILIAVLVGVHRRLEWLPRRRSGDQFVHRHTGHRDGGGRGTGHRLEPEPAAAAHIDVVVPA